MDVTEKHADLKRTETDPEIVTIDGERALAEKRLLRRIDLRMSPLVIIYILNYLDRNNASAARLRGMQTDLAVDDTQWATVLSILYVGYIIMQVPSNMVLNYIGRPSLYLPCAMIIWGVLSCLTGITTNFFGVVLCRFFLGFIEAAFFPGALLLLSKWYTRKELALRTSILFIGNLSSNAFNGLIAAGVLNNMQGVLGHAAWRWLFQIEGAATVAFAFVSMLILPDFPETTRWLTEDEKILAQKRMTEDAGEADISNGEGTGQMAGLKLAVTDYKVWWLFFILTSYVVGLSYNGFFPTLTATLGYNRTVTLLLCAPPWAFACIVAFANSWHADRTGDKFWHIAISQSFGIVGFIIASTTVNTGARYVSLFLMAQSYAGFCIVFTWISSTIARPTSKRAVALGLINGLSQLGNIAGSYAWPSKWGEQYVNSNVICISCFSASIAMSYLFKLHLEHLNRKLDAGEETVAYDPAAVEDAARLEGLTIEDALAARKGWRYLV